mmetsp:Transcript_50235/g.117227  ORF Transcript_50235/g.117227 Transcript_50235/m.117227 type:complete len:250 (-) Transcript_50235:8-757(-)
MDSAFCPKLVASSSSLFMSSQTSKGMHGMFLKAMFRSRNFVSISRLSMSQIARGGPGMRSRGAVSCIQLFAIFRCCAMKEGSLENCFRSATAILPSRPVSGSSFFLRGSALRLYTDGVLRSGTQCGIGSGNGKAAGTCARDSGLDGTGEGVADRGDPTRRPGVGVVLEDRGVVRPNLCGVGLRLSLPGHGDGDARDSSSAHREEPEARLTAPRRRRAALRSCDVCSRASFTFSTRSSRRSGSTSSGSGV